jgi:hypothetical protein
MGGSAYLRASCAVMVLGMALWATSCSNGGAPGFPVQPASGTGYVFIGDAPPPGTSILKFEITLSGATLCPTVGSGGECAGSPQVQLLTTPVTIEMTRLQLQSAFLSLKSVAAGTYGGVRLTFSNPEIKVMNLDGSVSTLEGVDLPLNPTSVTPTFSGGLTVGADTNFGLLIDLNVLESIQSSGGVITGIAPVVSLTNLPVTVGQTVEELEDTKGRVSNLNKTCPSGSFTLNDSMTGLPIASLRFDSTTEFDDDLTCEILANDQIVEADIVLRSDSLTSVQFFAKKLELANPADEPSLEGLIVQVNPFDDANNRYQLVLLVHEAENISGIGNGAFVTVNINPDTALFRVDADSLPVESSAFASGADLLAGQSVEVDVLSGSVVVGTNNCAAVEDGCVAGAEKIKLKKGSITANVQGTSQPNFTLTTLPSIFGTLTLMRRLSADCENCSIANITVVTSDQTKFEGLPGDFSGLQVGQTVTVRGLLIKNGFLGPGPIGSGSPQLVAGKVRLQMTP